MLPEENRATASGELHEIFDEDQSSSSRNMLANKQTDTQTGRSQYSAPLAEQSKNNF